MAALLFILFPITTWTYQKSERMENTLALLLLFLIQTYST